MHMNTPIWVWMYMTCELKHESGRDNMPALSAWPNAHSYAFLTEKEALEHPEKMGWKYPCSYRLQKTYLQT